MEQLHEELKTVRSLLADTQKQLDEAKFALSVSRCVELDLQDEVLALKEELWAYADRERKVEAIVNTYMAQLRPNLTRGVE